MTVARHTHVGARLLSLTATAANAVRVGAGQQGRRARSRSLQEVCARGLAGHGVQVSQHGAFLDEPHIVVANHVSWIDPLVVASLLPVTPIAKQEVRRWPLVGPLCEAMGCMFVKRGDVASGASVLRSARAALRESVSVLGFPEGTTRPVGTGLGPFHRGLFGLARRVKVPIVPVFLRYDDPATAWVGDDPFVPHWLSVVRRPRTTVTVFVGVPSRPLPGAPLGRFVDEVRRALADLGDARAIVVDHAAAQQATSARTAPSSKAA